MSVPVTGRAVLQARQGQPAPYQEVAAQSNQNPYQPSHAQPYYNPGYQAPGQGYPPAPPGQGYPPAPPGQGYPPAPPGQGYPPALLGQGNPPAPLGQGYPPAPPGQGYPPAYRPSGYPAMPQVIGYPVYEQNIPSAGYDPYGNGSDKHKNQFFGKPQNAPRGPYMNTHIDYDNKITPDVSTAIRHAFVRKVYCILSVQLLYTFGFALIFSLVGSARQWLIRFWWVALIFALVGLVLMIVISCCPHLGRQVPGNFILLSLITICMSWLVALGGASTKSTSFAIAAGITVAVCIGLTIFAIQTKWDFTGCGVFIFVALLILLLFGILAALIRNEILQIVYASLGALLFSFILVYDTQQVVGGKHRKYQYSIDDYIFGALTLYIDVINLFMMILSLVNTD